MQLTAKQLSLLADVVRRRSGLALPPEKADLVSSKLKPVAARFGCRTVAALLAELEDEPEELARAVTEAMTVNETLFFRNPVLFDHLRAVVLPRLMAARQDRKRLRIWCAAAATGQEPYSLAMLLDDADIYGNGWKIDLFATDLSREAVCRMQEGAYSGFEVERGLPEAYRRRYFAADGEMSYVVDHLRRRLRVHRFNLLDSFGWLGEMDLILCRNALLYFEHEARVETLLRLSRVLADDGYLVLGATETADLPDYYVPAGQVRGVFTKKNAALLRRAG